MTPSHSEQFQHVMVLVSIIVGVGITNLLMGVAQVLERATSDIRQLRRASIYFVWVAQVFLWMAFWWWYQFRLVDTIGWTLQRYLLSIAYAVSLFLMSALLVPRLKEELPDPDSFFIAQRRWFFSAYALATVVDIAETLSNGGWRHLLAVGWITNLGTAGTALLVFACIRWPNRKFQLAMGVISLLWAVSAFFETVPTLVAAG